MLVFAGKRGVVDIGRLSRVLTGLRGHMLGFLGENRGKMLSPSAYALQFFGFMKNIFLFRHAGFTLIAISILGMGCGKSSSTPVTSGNNTLSAVTISPNPYVPINTVCGSGMINIGGRGCYAGTFQQVCSALPGGYLTTVSGQQVCRLRSQYQVNYIGSNSYLARLTPGDPSASTAFQSGIPIYSGDKVEVSASGGWGTIDYNLKSYLGGFFQIWKPSGDCNQVRVDGKSTSDGSSVTNNENSQSAGLWMSDGSQTYYIGSHAKHGMTNSGTLYFGVNAPMDGSKCGTINLSSIVIDHCENASGTSVSCY